MHFLRTLQVGKRAAESQVLLNTISTAAGCLLDPSRKAEYDRQLRAQHANRGGRGGACAAPLVPAPRPTAAPPPPPTPAIQPVIVNRQPSSGSQRPGPNSPFTATLALSLAALIGLPLIGLAGLGLARLLPAGDPHPEKGAPRLPSVTAVPALPQPGPLVPARDDLPEPNPGCPSRQTPPCRGLPNSICWQLAKRTCG